MSTGCGRLCGYVSIHMLLDEGPATDQPGYAELCARSNYSFLTGASHPEELVLRASTPADAQGRATLGLAELGPELARGGRSSRVAVPLIAGDELLGLLIGEGSTSVELARAVASQAAVGIKKIQLIERLTEKNLIKDFFEDIASGRAGGDV